jgi:hypothetical protein
MMWTELHWVDGPWPGWVWPPHLAVVNVLPAHGALPGKFGQADRPRFPSQELD